MAKNIDIAGRLHSVATENVVAGANEIYDDNKEKKQSEINAELLDAQSELRQELNEGLDAKQDTITKVTASVDDNVGKPEVTPTFNGGKLDLDFRNLKGVRGNGIASSSESLSDRSGGVNTHVFMDDDGNAHEFHTLNGRKGERGDSFQPIADASGLILAHALGDDDTKAISQKGVTDAFAGYFDMEYTLANLVAGNIKNDTVNEKIVIGGISHYYHGVFPVKSGKHGRITTAAGTGTARAYCFLDDEYIVLWTSGDTSATYDNEEFEVPAGAAYICVNFKDNAGVTFALEIDGTIGEVINDAVEELRDGDIGDIKDDVEELKNALSPQTTEYTADDMEGGQVVNAPVGVTYTIGRLNGFRHLIIPCTNGKLVTVTTLGSTGSGSSIRGFAFADGDGVVIETSDIGQISGVFEAPEGSASCLINCAASALDTFHVEVSSKPSLLDEIKNDLDGVKEDVQELKDTLSPQSTVYEASDLDVGNINNKNPGEAYIVGTQTSFKHLIVPCVNGQTVTITTSGGTKSSTTARGIAFADENNIILQSSTYGPISGEFPAPENSAYCLVNCTTSALETFRMEVSTKESWMGKIRSDVDKLREDVDNIINEHTEEDIPLYHGKDMFFIKDTPLDFYAQNVLFKNYPRYKGVYVSCAEDLSRRSTNDFSVPVITHVNPTGKVYFKDGDTVGIYADDGKLYKDSWNAVTGITAHTTDLSTKQDSINVMFFGSSTTEYGLATYVKNYLSGLGVTVNSIGHKNDSLGTPSEGYAGWSNEMICGKKKSSSSSAISTSPFIRVATAEDKQNYPDYCFKYGSGVDGTSYTDASDKTGDFYIFDFAWFLDENNLDTPDVVFFLLGINGTAEDYGIYMPWIVDRIMQACPNCKIGINVAQAIRLQTEADDKVEEDRQKFDMLYSYVTQKNSLNLKVVSCHCYQSPYFAHKFTTASGENAVTSKVGMDMTDAGKYLHMRNAGYQQIAKAIGAYIAYCLPDEE